MLKFMLVLLCALGISHSLAQTRSSKLKPLYFQAGKNKLQVLPQRFEYTLLDEDRLKIGDILLDTTQVSFQVEPSPNLKDTYQIHFSWPAGLIQEGRLSLKNNSGKAIFNKLINKEMLKISEGNAEDEPEGLRSEIATLTVDGIEAILVDDMKYLPFMAFCIYRESDETRLYLCSKELYLNAQDDKMVVKSRSSRKKTAQIEINGKLVGNQGIIYLNDRSENVAFKMQTQSGAFLEIETRKQDVDFKDIVISDDNESLVLTASGAEPVDESKVKKISETEWQIKLPKSRPVFYLKGDGDIPMRQEFYVRGPLPRAKIRPYLSPKSPERTYSSKVSFNGIIPEGVQIKIPEGDLESDIEFTKKNQFQWTFRNISSGQPTRRYLTVSTEGKDYIAGYDVFRGHPFSLELKGKYLTPSGIVYGSVNFQWWLENFLFINANWSRFHWGFAFESEQQLTEKDDIIKVNFNTFEILWRAKEGFNFVDESWGLTLPLQMIQVENGSTTAFGIGAFWLNKPTSWLKKLMQWSELKMQYFAGSTGGDFKIKSATRLKASAHKSLTNQLFFNYGLNFTDYKLDPSASKEDPQLGIETGLTYKF